jgi:hypothetical protein
MPIRHPGLDAVEQGGQERVDFERSRAWAALPQVQFTSAFVAAFKRSRPAIEAQFPFLTGLLVNRLGTFAIPTDEGSVREMASRLEDVLYQAGYVKLGPVSAYVRFALKEMHAFDNIFRPI